MKLALAAALAATQGFNAGGGRTPDVYRPPRNDKAWHIARAEAKRARKARKRLALYDGIEAELDRRGVE